MKRFGAIDIARSVEVALIQQNFGDGPTVVDGASRKSVGDVCPKRVRLVDWIGATPF